ncbi:hypothetical protein MBAV_005151 [Candidatus Magnetobacterium bavaricum]|uniref:Uncharacterized protein n=1 Tax=Candidatus Magnetobacterium bavaricum TaxID=29290 RepID=A0A0F3GPN6_9BACT|nr:hypothetical protein MBAV_005151 [Candidatus Magnetobacterium bavaricum]
MLATEWNDPKNTYAAKFGRVSLYPVERMSPPVHDSILNFYEMWESGELGKGINEIDETIILYFEINEDFNLNLKLDSDILTLPVPVRDAVWKRLNAVQWPSMVNGKSREYKHSVYVLYEWDFGFLQNLNNIPTVASILSCVLDKTIHVL